MKKLISILLVITIMAAFVACGNKANTETSENPDNVAVNTEKDTNDNVDTAEDQTENQAEDKKGSEASKNEAVTTTKPAENKPATSQKPSTTKPSGNKPVENLPAELPAEKPAEKPAETESSVPATLGNKLLAEFKAKASSMDTEALANALVTSSFIEFTGMAMPVEEGLLAGFDNTEIKGFKSGATFAPMIGSIPFVGYVFELENAADTAAFISTLRANANLRWNICVEAEEMVTGSVGNKVFFVMCPTSMD